MAPTARHRPARPDRAATDPSPPHRRDAAATRAAILEAARTQFTAVGYDHAGVREIAAAAGVTGALVNRYFGSKERLFAEVLATSFRIDTVLPARPEELAEALARDVGARPGPIRPEGDALLLLLRSAANPVANRMLRDHVDAQLVAPLAEFMGHDHAELRAAVVVGCLMGVAIVRRVLQSAAMSPGTEDDLRALLASALHACLEAPVASRAPDPPARRRARGDVTRRRPS